MHTQNKVSIIVPVYNTEPYLPECLDSIVKQTYSNLEIILINDGSSDRSLCICKDYQEKDNRIILINKENEGLISAWMDGVKVSTGDYFVFVDSDDWIETTMIEEMMNQTNGQEEVICGNYLFERENITKPYYQPIAAGIYQGEKLAQVIPNLLGNEERIIILSRCMKLFSRKLIIDNLKYCNKKVTMGEDVTIVLPALISSKRIVILEQGLHYHYRQLESSMVHKYNKELVEKIALLNKQIKFILKDKKVLNGIEQANKEKIFLAFLVIKNEIRSGVSGYQKRIIEFSKEESIKRIMKGETLEISQNNNKLLYFVLKYPNAITIWLLKSTMKLHGILRK